MHAPTPSRPVASHTRPACGANALRLRELAAFGIGLIRVAAIA